MTGEYADEHARVYHERFSDSGRGDVSYYRDLARGADGPVLEAACGTGRVYLELLAAGVDADGFDRSRGALAVLREYAARRGLEPSVWQASLTDVAVDRAYALVVCPFNTFQHLHSIEQQLAALEAVYGALSPGGTFAFDVFVPNFDLICGTYDEWQRETIDVDEATYELQTRSRIVDEAAQVFAVEETATGPDGKDAFDIDEAAVEAAAAAGAQPAASIPDVAEQLGEQKYLWLMVPAGEAVDAALDELAAHLDGDDVVVDGGNSHFEASVRRAETTEASYLDCGTSGGPAGAQLGFSLMVGGPALAYERLEPVFDAVATGPDGHDRLGESGAGHYVKMVHNGVEYALMQAYGEGFELLHEGRYDLGLEAVARTWNNGAVIRSWLLELCEEAFREEGGNLGDVADNVGGGSTGTWTVRESLEQEVPLPLIYQALAERFGSRTGDDGRFARRLANRLRYGFGRHDIERQ